ncbi:MAG: hypothetical protein VYE18_07220 [Pseudomonadota bacterium]|nr:hypothetical protein [Pseudomonadota bacterium]
MRQATIITLLVAAMMSVALFFLKYEVIDLETELNLLNRAIVSDREMIHVLEAEWSHLNDTARLKDLAERHLKLRPTQPDQLRTAEQPLAPKEFDAPRQQITPAAEIVQPASATKWAP